mmetsp:Transcript_41796/g.69568  ORF Transcript_41796/g.69568 Transcript_41796/m.69568 type:complete len:527 (+) Transcript_41796:96-1676(+)
MKDESVPKAARIFITGAASGAGKSTVCLGVLGSLLKHYPASQIGYIKPATQGVQSTLTAKYCQTVGIDYRHVGPVVFYRGFTERYLEGATESSEEMLDQVRAAVDEIAMGKRVVVMDGVGHPGVGAMVGVDNAAIAQACHSSVLVVGKQGLGQAIDSFELCASYFEAQHISVLGVIFNRLSASFDKQQQLTSYFNLFRPRQRVYGFLVENPAFQFSDDYAKPGETNICTINNARSEKVYRAPVCTAEEKALCDSLVADFISSGVDVQQLTNDADEAHMQPAAFVKPARAIVQQCAQPTSASDITVCGFETCPFYLSALSTANELVAAGLAARLSKKEFSDRDVFLAWLHQEGRAMFPKAVEHESCPFIYFKPGATAEPDQVLKFIGGSDDLTIFAGSLHRAAASKKRKQAPSDHGCPTGFTLLEDGPAIAAFASSRRYAVICFTAPWCSNSQKMKPIVQKLAAEKGATHEADFAVVNADKSQSIVEAFGVKGLPTYVLYTNGEQVGQVAGANSDKLTELIRAQRID